MKVERLNSRNTHISKISAPSHTITQYKHVNFRNISLQAKGFIVKGKLDGVPTEEDLKNIRTDINNCGFDSIVYAIMHDNKAIELCAFITE